jgi:hypothetical protein
VSRAQSNLLAVAVVLLVASTGLAVAVADDALVRADREPLVRHAAAATADRLVAGESPVTRRPAVLDRSRAANLTAAVVDALVPSARERALAIRLDGRTLVERGQPTGPTIRRSVRVVRSARAAETYETYGSNVTRIVVPPSVDRVQVRVRPGPNATARTLRADRRVVLYDPDGLDGTATVRLSPRDRTVLRLPAANATVRVAYDRPRTETATLEVRAGAR